MISFGNERDAWNRLHLALKVTSDQWFGGLTYEPERYKTTNLTRLSGLAIYRSNYESYDCLSCALCYVKPPATKVFVLTIHKAICRAKAVGLI